MIDFNNISAVIFDFDGTLYCKKHFALKLVFSSLHNALKMKAERNCRRELKGQYFGSEEAYFSEFIRLLCEKTGMKKEKAGSWYKNFYIPQMVKILDKNYSAFVEVPQIFAKLKERSIKIVVYSDYRDVENRMKAIGLEPQTADFLFSAEELGGLKPARQPFLKISEKLGVSPENILVVGDRTDTDGDGAKNAGMQFVQVTQTQSLATCFAQFLPC